MLVDPITGVQIRVGVMGAASEPSDPAVAGLCRRLGRTVAERGACLLTGASPGLPHESVLGAKETGGHVVGISPAATLREHVEKFGSPYHEYDVLIFTGLGLLLILELRLSVLAKRDRGRREIGRVARLEFLGATSTTNGREPERHAMERVRKLAGPDPSMSIAGASRRRGSVR